MPNPINYIAPQGLTFANSRRTIASEPPKSERVVYTYAEHTIYPPPPCISSKLPLYFLTALTAAALLLFTLLAGADNAAAQINSPPYFVVDDTDCSASPLQLNADFGISLDEEQPTGTLLADFDACDADGDDLAFSLRQSSDSALFAIDSSSGVLSTNGRLDYETQTSYSLEIQVFDTAYAQDQVLVTIRLIDVDDAVPTPGAPTITPTPSETPEGVSAKLNALEERQEAMQASLGIVQRLAQTLQAFIDALVVRVDALERGYHPTVTPSPTSLPTLTPTPTRVPGSTPVPTAEPTATPTLTPTPTLAAACIGKIGLGWLTGTWNADCLSDKTPPTAKAGTRYARFYTFTLDAPAAVTVNISSTDVANTYLYLLEGVGNEGAVVNRGDTRISEQLPTGAYTIEATTYNLQTVGNFTLTMDISR